MYLNPYRHGINRLDYQQKTLIKLNQIQNQQDSS